MKVQLKNILPNSFPMILIWIVPVIVFIAAGWMLYSDWSETGESIFIEFENGDGLQAGQTKLKFRGVDIGSITEIRLKDDLSGVVTKVQLQKEGMELAREGALFWIVRPEIGISGVRGLGTIVSGVHLTARAGEGPAMTRFKGLDRPPPPRNTDQGRAFLLRTDSLGGIKPGAPVLYRQIQVGEVETSQLTTDSKAVLVRIRIYEGYSGLVRTNTKFWNASSAPVNISLFGGGDPGRSSFETIITGAIALATPEEYGEAAEAGSEFPLAGEAEDKWLKWKPDISIEPIRESPEKLQPSRVNPLF